MGISAGAAAAIAGGIGLGVAAERTGTFKTPGGDIARSAGLDVSGGVYGKKSLPGLLQPIEPTKPMPTINDDAVKKARNSKLLNLQKQSGAASTILTGDKFGG